MMKTNFQRLRKEENPLEYLKGMFDKFAKEGIEPLLYEKKL